MSTPTVSKLHGTGYRSITSPTKTSGQMDLLNLLMGGSKGGLSGGLDQLSQMAGGGSEEYWNQMEAPAMRQFGQLQGNIASRFSGMGSGARRSSGFQNAQSGAATDFAERLQSQRMGLQQSAIQQLMGLGQNLLGQDLFQTSFIPKKKSGWETFFEGLSGLGSNFLGGRSGF